MRAALTTNDHLTVSQSTQIPITQLLTALGSIENISSVSANINVLHAILIDSSKIDYDALEQLGIKGLFLSGDKLRMVIGDDAVVVADLIQQQKQSVLES